jgi:ketosteroid isomerase-like protein
MVEGPKEQAMIDAVLDAFHAAASVADEDAYFAALAQDAVFLGTDGSERWSGEEYRAFVHTFFARGMGWTYNPSSRSITVAADGKTAWFDEQLDNVSYGECRGTGVLQQHDGQWKIEQYNLTIPLPNELVSDFVERIRQTR